MIYHILAKSCLCEGCPDLLPAKHFEMLKELGKRRSGIPLPLVLVSLFLVTARAEHDPAGEQEHLSVVENTFYTKAFLLGNNMIAFFSWTSDPRRLAPITVFFHYLLRLRSLGMKI